MRKYLVLKLFLLLTTISFSQRLAEVDSLIYVKLNEDKHASLAVGVIKSGEIVHLSTQGYKDIENKFIADVNTSYHIASLSKTVTNLAVFKLLEEQKINLNNDINSYLPFKIINPHSPDRIIKVKDLLNHRSCIVDDIDFYVPLWHASKGDSKEILKEFLFDYLLKEGNNYSAEHFTDCHNFAPFKYSNTAFAILGLIVEHVSKMTFEEFCQEKIFQPLNMDNTSWFLSALDPINVAKTYTFTDSTALRFEGHNGYPDYPAGQLRTSISDFTNLIQKFLIVQNSDFIIDENTRNIILPLPQHAQVGFYTWFLNPLNNNLYYQHGGRDKGVRTRAMVDRNFNHAIIIFSNSNANVGSLLRSIEKSLFTR